MDHQLNTSFATALKFELMRRNAVSLPKKIELMHLLGIAQLDQLDEWLKEVDCAFNILALAWLAANGQDALEPHEPDQAPMAPAPHGLDLAQPGAPASPSPAASPWAVDGKTDPRDGQYHGDRSHLCMGSLTDDEMANAVLLYGHPRPRIEDVVSVNSFMPNAYLRGAKDRIHWLSRALNVALAALADLSLQPQALYPGPPASPVDGDQVEHFVVLSNGFELAVLGHPHQTHSQVSSLAALQRTPMPATSSTMAFSACACMGPMYGEAHCPCVMASNGVERSAQWKAANTPEALKERNERMHAALSQVFGWDKNAPKES